MEQKIRLTFGIILSGLSAIAVVSLLLLLAAGNSVQPEQITQQDPRLLLAGVLFGLSALTFLITVILLLLLSQSLLRPFQAVLASLIKAVTNESWVAAEVASEDEIGKLAYTTRQIYALLEQLARVHKISQSLQSLTNTLSTLGSQQLEDSREQMSAINQVTTALEELGNSAGQIADFAAQVATFTVSTKERIELVVEAGTASRDRASKMVDAVQTTLAGVEQVGRQVDEFSLLMRQLARQSESIDKVVNLIQTIAEEVHLLSLNAAIEAAGAGEFGERFGVVAQEIRLLAARSKKATTEVSNFLNQIQLSNRAALLQIQQGQAGIKLVIDTNNSMRHNLQEMEQSTEQVGLAVEQILNLTREVSKRILEIKQATYQQHIASNQATIMARSVDLIAEKTAYSTEYSAAHNAWLVSLSNQLHSVVTSENSAAGFTTVSSEISQPGAKVELQVYVHKNHAFELVKPVFEQHYPWLSLKLLEGSEVEVLDAMLEEGLAVPDILWPQPHAIQRWGKTGHLLDVTELVNQYKDKLVPGKLIESYIPSTGRFAALPGDIGAVGLYYRGDLWDKAGLTIPTDWTWDEFIEISQKLKRDRGLYTMWLPSPEAARGFYNNGAAVGLLWGIFMSQMGGSVTNAAGSIITLDDEKGLAAMQLIRKIWQAGICFNGHPIGEKYRLALQAGQIAATPMPGWYRALLLEPHVKTAQAGLGQWRLTLLPRPWPGGARTANYGGSGIAAPNITQYPQQVKTFLEFASCSHGGAHAIARWGSIPAYLPYLESTDWKNMRSPVFGNFAFNQVWSEALKEYPTSWYKQAVFMQALNEIEVGLHDVLSGRLEAEKGLELIGTRVRKINGEYCASE